MDISTITDVDKLKSLAYDQLAVLDQTQTNLKLINERIAQVQAEEEKATTKSKS